MSRKQALSIAAKKAWATRRKMARAAARGGKAKTTKTAKPASKAKPAKRASAAQAVA